MVAFVSHTHWHVEVSSLCPSGQLNELSHKQEHVSRSNMYIGGQVVPFVSHTHSHDEVSSLCPSGQLNELLHKQEQISRSNMYIGGQVPALSHSHSQVASLNS